MTKYMISFLCYCTCDLSDLSGAWNIMQQAKVFLLYYINVLFLFKLILFQIFSPCVIMYNIIGFVVALREQSVMPNMCTMTHQVN